MQARPIHPKPDDGRRARGSRTRDAAIDAAIQLASVQGLEGLSIARLAKQLGAAKSTVHATFGSKESLQLAVIDKTREMLIELVVVPSLSQAPGYQRLDGLGRAWLTYLSGNIFEGGCLLSSASAEFDGRPGPARDALVAVLTEWLDLLAKQIAKAVSAGEFDATVVPEQLAFELNAIGMAANWHYQLLQKENSFVLAQTAWDQALTRYRIRNSK